MNLVSGRLADTEKAEDDVIAKTGYELIKNKMNGITDLDTRSSDIKRLQENVKGLIKQCEYVFQPGMVSGKERAMRSKGMRSVQACPMTGMHQNMFRQMKKGTSAKRSSMQKRVKQTDYSKYSDSDS